MIVNGVEKPLPRPMTAQEYLEENGFEIVKVERLGEWSAIVSKLK